ncbi:Protein mlp1 [Polyrhizophydium stewartii]|uniref:Protein mlp1 n=1 Tax=Polyrhizophydium stewartii TaxID=2732419 RepID=A0ABR4N4M9_9FUNG
MAIAMTLAAAAGASVHGSAPSRPASVAATHATVGATAAATPEQLSRLLALSGLDADTHFAALFQAVQAVPSLGALVRRLDGFLTPRSLETASPHALRALIERMRADKIVAETEFEQRAHDLESQARDLANQLAEYKAQAEQLRSSKDSNSSLVSSLRQELRIKEAEIGSWHEKDLASQSLVQSLDSEKRSLANQLAKKHEELVRANDEADHSRQSLQQVRDELRAALVKITELQSGEIELRSTSSAREQQIEQLQKSNEWLSDELKRRTTQLSEYRREKSDQLSSLQSKFELLAQDKTSLESAHALLQARNADLEHKLHAASEKSKESDSRLLLIEQQFKNEMSSQKRLTDLYHTKCQELSEQNSELETQLQDYEARIEQMRDDYATAETSAQQELDQASRRISELEAELERTREELDVVASNPSAAAAANPLSELSAAAAAMSSAQKSGKSMTDIVAEYHDLKARLVRSQHEEERLREMVQHIMAELEERAPALHQNKIDLARANEELERISTELAAALRERDAAAAEARISVADRDALHQENLLLQQESRDLGRQVQALLRQIEQTKLGSGSLDMLDRTGSDDGFANLSMESAADAIISERLVVFGSIEELQKQNQTLRRSLREMAKKVETFEQQQTQAREQWQTAELKEAARCISTLQNQLTHQSSTIQTLVRERDGWRTMAEGRGTSGHGRNGDARSQVGSPMRDSHEASADRALALTPATSEYEQLYRNLQRDFDIFRKESAADIKMLKSQQEQLLKEKADLSIQVATLNSQHQYAQERHDFLRSKLAAQESESQQLRSRMQLLTEQSARQDAKTQELTDSLMEARLASDTLRGENQQLKIEREVWKSSEARAIREAQDLVRERNAANDRLRELQLQLEERERLASTEKIKADDRLEVLSRDLQLVHKQLSDALDDSRTISARRDAEQKEAHIKIERLTTQIEKLRGELLLSQNKEETLSARAQDLASRLAVADEKLALLEGRGRTSSTLGAEASDQDKIRDLELKVAESRSQIDALRAELEVEKERCATFQGISQANEERLAEMNGTYDIFKGEMEASVARKQAEIDALEAEKAELAKQIEENANELRAAKEQAESDRAEFERAKEVLQARMHALHASETKALSDKRRMHEDVERYMEQARIAQENYEREVVLHSAAIQRVSALKDENRELYERSKKAESRLKAAEANLQTSLASAEAMRTKLDEQIQELQKRIEDLTQQNELLHAQFEQVSHTRARDGSDTGALEASGEAGAALTDEDHKKIDDLREVIRFLRREKSILETRLEVAVQETQRMSLQVDHLQRSLDETRALLDEERKQQQGAMATEKKHRELLEKIEQANVLRESNVTLRDQVDQSMRRIRRLEKQLADTDAELVPLRERTVMLEAEIEARKLENAQLAEDNERWKGRTQQILQKYERIDPVEHETLKANVEKLATERDAARNDIKELRTALETQLQQRQQQIDQLSVELGTLRNELAHSHADAAAKSAELQQVIADADQKAKDSDARMRDLINRSNAINNKIKESKDKTIGELRQRLTEIEQASVEAASALSAKHQEEIEQMQTNTQRQTDLKWEARLSGLQKIVERQKAEIASLQQRVQGSVAASAASPHSRVLRCLVRK